MMTTSGASACWAVREPYSMCCLLAKDNEIKRSLFDIEAHALNSTG